MLAEQELCDWEAASLDAASQYEIIYQRSETGFDYF